MLIVCAMTQYSKQYQTNQPAMIMVTIEKFIFTLLKLFHPRAQERNSFSLC